MTYKNIGFVAIVKNWKTRNQNLLICFVCTAILQVDYWNKAKITIKKSRFREINLSTLVVILIL